jgi:O-antigen/teichoic acid export membrane protein
MTQAGEWVDAKMNAGAVTDTDQVSDSSAGDPLGVISATTAETRGSSASLLSSGELARLIVRGGASSLFISVAGAALSLGVHLTLARILGAVEYGQYVYALAWMNVLVLVAKFELDTASVRFVGAYTATEQWSFLRGFLRRSSEIVGGLSIAIGAASAVAALALMDRIGRGTALSFVAASLLLPVAAMGQLKASAMQGLKLVARAQAPSMVIRPIVFVLGVVAVRFAFDRSVTAPVAILLQLGATTVALVLTIHFLRVVIPEPVRQAREAFDTRYWLKTAAGLLVISGGQIILSTNSDVLVVGSLLGAEPAGRYGAASQLAAAVSFGVSAVSFIALPVVADLYAKQAFVKLQGLISHVARLGLALSVPVLLVLIVAAKPVLRAFGPSFADASGLLILLGFDQLVGAIFGIAGFLLVMTGHQVMAARVIIACAVLNLALTFTLTPLLGIMGAGLATTITTLVRSYLLMTRMRRALGLSLAPWYVPTSDPPPEPTDAA